jgi:hypothetical protein
MESIVAPATHKHNSIVLMIMIRFNLYINPWAKRDVTPYFTTITGFRIRGSTAQLLARGETAVSLPARRVDADQAT